MRRLGNRVLNASRCVSCSLACPPPSEGGRRENGGLRGGRRALIGREPATRGLGTLLAHARRIHVLGGQPFVERAAERDRHVVFVSS
ncbi:hypothetical protein JTE90_010415 [Oedothorax gibbosus]|uniref:Uncharacterized protein n=1 Tax=Oedothorax gibbosus TaxID=931172 RepID=A0AAV6VZK0_9ARAC|nr:hypothetical protein JTE90_010415 [Oedothorax gibbosus]